MNDLFEIFQFLICYSFLIFKLLSKFDIFITQCILTFNLIMFLLLFLIKNTKN